MQKTSMIFQGSQNLPASYKGGTVILGNFDGWHLGHQQLCQLAFEKVGLPIIILTFEPHPRQFFNKNADPFRLTSLAQKTDAILSTKHVAGVVVEEFNHALSSQTAEDFIAEILVKNLGAAHVIVGYDFHFGKGRGGNADTIKAKIPTTIIDAITDNKGDIISSSHIRNAIGKGEVDKVPQYLGRPFSISGVVETGDKLGRQIGFPTANLSLGDYTRPLCGVYASCATLQGQEFHSVTNYGFRPTVDGKQERFETYIFDFDNDIYGDTLEVSLLKLLRPEMKFAGLEELKTQIAKDCITAREFLRE